MMKTWWRSLREGCEGHVASKKQQLAVVSTIHLMQLREMRSSSLKALATEHLQGGSSSMHMVSLFGGVRYIWQYIKFSACLTSVIIVHC